ncbi:sensor histidine kinase [Trinickia violacea]|uniref:histidine kinase n=1 Tax=Trinickia violacea TaxID=2571746 RepID=A0A4P8IM85_9BURK|nr:sensor histidine kinase [Trinickia violacea]QCP48907.1 sensor histidine kinase [Trinickia violacea]
MEQLASYSGMPGNDAGREFAPGNRMFLSTVPAGPGERRLALTLMLVSVAAFLVAVPFAKREWPVIWAFIPTYESALVVTDSITSMLLFGQFYSLRSQRLLALACGYLFTAGMTVAHALSFPGLFAPGGLIGAGPQSTAWIYMFWHAGFPLFVIAYALLKGERIDDGPLARMLEIAPRRAILLCAAIVLALVLGFAAFATAGRAMLPDLLHDGRFTPVYRVAIALVWATSLAAFLVLLRYGTRSTLDMWLRVVLCAWMIDIALAAMLNHGRFDLGFYVGRIYGLISASFVLVVLLVESGMLYARLAALTRRDLQERMRVKELEHLGLLSAGIQAAREEEQKRIARELHDDLGQRLTAIKIDLTMFEADLQDRAMSPELRAQAQSMQSLIDETVTSVRRIAAGLRPVALDDLGLVPALEWLARDFETRYGIPVLLDFPTGEPSFNSGASTAVFRIVQEALTNVARHAQATQVHVQATLVDDAWRVIVADNGRGIAADAPRKDTSFGLLGIRERVRLLNGTAAIETAPGQGLRLTVDLPLAAVSDDSPA